MLRSCAISPCEPRQDGNVAALNEIRYVPQGSFNGVTCVVTASVKIFEKRCTVFLFARPPKKRSFILFSLDKKKVKKYNSVMIKENLEKIFKEIENGNNLGEKITLVGATKMQSADVVNEAISCGLTDFGENKAQEFRDKNDFISPFATRHFIGRLQANKVKYLVGKVFLIHSVDSFSLAEEISSRSQKLGLTTNVLAEVNFACDENKGGIKENELDDFLKKVTLLPNIKVLGLMTVAPNLDDENALAEIFDRARQRFDELKTLYPDFKYLSMGMSGDYKTAIKHGSNMIRLGTSIFGKRNYGDN